MTKDQERQIDELIAAGEEATQGKWTVHRGQEFHAPSDRLSFHYPIREEDGLTDIIPDENGDQDYPNIGQDMVFAATSANSREAIKTLRDENKNLRAMMNAINGQFELGDYVRKKGDKGQWHGRICGWYSTEITPIGYAVESAYEKHSVQIYPESALEFWKNNEGNEQAKMIEALRNIRREATEYNDPHISHMAIMHIVDEVLEEIE